MTSTIKIGDRIKFSSATWWGTKSVWRKVNGFTPKGLPTVRFGGHPDFIVRIDEISDIKAAA